MTEKWNKYSYLNTENNCLIEVTHLEGTEEKLILTPLNNSPYLLLSVEDATIKEHPTNERNTMEQTTTVPETYNPNLLVTYKKIAGTFAAPEAPEFITDKVVDIEWPAEEALGFIGLCILAVVGYWIYLNWQAVLTVVVISIVVTIIFFSIKNSNKKVQKRENVVAEKQQRQVKKSDDELTASDIGWGLMGIGLVSSLIIKFLN